MEKCYDCGKELQEGQKTKEHIPAQSLFEGFDESYKKNRIIVPSCFDCNNGSSPHDEEFRNWIGMVTNHVYNAKISEKAMRGLIRKDPGATRLNIDLEGHLKSVKFDKAPIIKYHVKMLKGIYYHQYGIPISPKYDINIFDNEKDWSDGTMSIIGHLKTNFPWQHSGHPDVFRYILQPYREGQQPTTKNIDLKENEKYIMALMVHNNTRAVIAIAFRPN